MSKEHLRKVRISHFKICWGLSPLRPCLSRPKPFLWQKRVWEQKSLKSFPLQTHFLLEAGACQHFSLSELYFLGVKDHLASFARLSTRPCLLWYGCIRPWIPCCTSAQQCLYKCMISGRELISVPIPRAASQLRNYFKHHPMCISASPISSANLWCFRWSFDSAQMQSNKFIALYCGTAAPKFIAISLSPGNSHANISLPRLSLPVIGVLFLLLLDFFTLSNLFAQPFSFFL